MRSYPDIAVQVGPVLLPKQGVDLHKWAVIACDQFTSQPEYWQKVEEIVGSAPSTYHMILPEVFLNTPEESARVQSTQAAMRQYLEDGLLMPYEGFLYVERTVGGKTRKGLLMALDLEQYDFHAGSQSLIRATEGTIVERLPPRMRIREGAPLELPHILVLIDDPKRTVIEPLAEAQDRMEPLYGFDLMLGSGSVRGMLVNHPAEEARIVSALRRLADPARFREEYRVGEDKGVLLFAMGDGNHSLATAKSIWEKMKDSVGPNHPARYALVEVENVHDTGLAFEPIHRVLFGANGSWQPSLKSALHGAVRFTPMENAEALLRAVKDSTGSVQNVGAVSEQGFTLVQFDRPTSHLSVGTLQTFLDAWMQAGGAREIDYVHGDAVACGLGLQPGNLSFILPPMQKGDLFKTVILDGVLPRKTFSMGEAHEKRFYIESRKIA